MLAIFFSSNITPLTVVNPEVAMNWGESDGVHFQICVSTSVVLELLLLKWGSNFIKLKIDR
jgi:hypothetical protein